MATNEDLLELLNEKQLKGNISKKLSEIHKYTKGIDVLRSSSEPLDAYTKARILFLEAKIIDYKEAISTWQTILNNLPKQS